MPKFRKLTEEEVSWTETQEGMGFQTSKRGRPRMPQGLRDRVVSDYKAQVSTGRVVAWRFSATEVAERNKISVPTMYAFLREAGVPTRTKPVEKGEQREHYANGLADLEWRLPEIAKMYNEVDRRGSRVFTVSQVSEKYLVSNQTITEALKIAEDRGIRVDWRRETNTRIVRS